MLSGQKIGNESEAEKVMEWFHEQGVKTVVLSSTDLGQEGELVAMASSIASQYTRATHKFARAFSWNIKLMWKLSFVVMSIGAEFIVRSRDGRMFQS